MDEKTDSQGKRNATEFQGKRAAAIIIGNEILSGSVNDTNTPFLIKELRKLGVCLERICILPDEADVIAEELNKASLGFDYVFTSGGIGPTHDDVTMEAVARAMNVRVVYSERLLHIMNERVGDRLNESLKKMAQVPEGAKLVFDCEMVYPLVAYKNIFILPGVPELFREKFFAIRERLKGKPFFVTRFLLLVGEGRIAEPLCQAAQAFPDVSMGSYPTFRNPEYRVQLVLESQDQLRLQEAVAYLKTLLLPEWIYQEY